MTNDAQSDALLRIEQIPDGGFHELEATLDGDAESLILYREGDAVRAWLNVCPHAGRRLDWAPGKFLKDKNGHLICAVHGATFELVGGECVAGPCRGAALRTIDIDVTDGVVRLRT
jgi:nitrite reductase/ring-hydroxylating ferredoxin subunit